MEEVFVERACYPSEEGLLDARSQPESQSPLTRRVGNIRHVKREESRAQSGLAALEQAFHVWYHLSSTKPSEKRVGVPGEVVALSVQALACVPAVLLSLVT